MFLQIHTLTSYPASLLNRDDAGLAKRIPFGNASRLRVSSQCQKRHWREQLAEALPELPDGLRTRSFFTRTVLPRLVESGVAQDRAEALVQALAKGVIDGGVKDNGELNQPVLFGLREADYFVSVLGQIHEEASSTADAVKALVARLKSPDEKKNIAAMRAAAAGLTGTLFGRFVTSDLLARVDAPVHVAHAFTVHGAASEMDYFTVVDDLNRSDETGAAHANQAELGAGLYYGYVVVDLPLLISNLHGCERAAWQAQAPETALKLLAQLIATIATKSPGAKLGSTAPHSRAELVLLEAGREQPRTLANAYLQALDLKGAGAPMQRACDRMGQHLRQLDGMYGAGTQRQLSTIHDAAGFGGLQAQPLPQAIEAALKDLWA